MNQNYYTFHWPNFSIDFIWCSNPCRSHWFLFLFEWVDFNNPMDARFFELNDITFHIHGFSLLPRNWKTAIFIPNLTENTNPLLDHSLSQPFPGQPLLQVREKGYTGYYNYRMNTSCAIIKFEHNRRATTNIFSRCQITESCRIELEG